MLDQLPAEILLEVFRYVRYKLAAFVPRKQSSYSQVDKNTLINLYQLCRRFYSIIDPQLREIHRTKKFSLNTDLTLSGSVEKRTLKFIEDLVFVSTCEDDQGLDCFQESNLSSGLDENSDDGIVCYLMPVFWGLGRDNLASFTCDLACFPSPGCGLIY